MEHGDPISQLTLASGTEVFTSDGESVGVVEQVLAAEGTDIFDGLVIDRGSGPAGTLRRRPGGRRAARARLATHDPAAEIDRLPKPGRNPAVMEHHGAEDAEGLLQNKLRGAWEQISGKG